MNLILLINHIKAGVSDNVRAEWLIQWTSNAAGRIEEKEESESRYGDLKNVSISARVEFISLSFILQGQVGCKSKRNRYYSWL